MSREAFEKWANLSELVSFANNFDRRGEGYHDPMINLAWWAWQAALLQQAGEAVMEYRNSPSEMQVVWETLPYGTHKLYTSPQAAVPEGFVPLGYKHKTGEWVYLNHAGEWHLCPCPQVPEPQR